MTTLFSALMYRGECRPVQVECEISEGIGFHLVGIPDAAVKNILLCVVTALQNGGFRVPGKKVVINYANTGAELPCECYDALALPTALAILFESGQVKVNEDRLNEIRFVGGVSIHGKIYSPYCGLLSDHDAAIVIDWYFRTFGRTMGWEASDTCAWLSATNLVDAINQLK